MSIKICFAIADTFTISRTFTPNMNFWRSNMDKEIHWEICWELKSQKEFSLRAAQFL